jgi:hypothetical protein
MLGNYSGHNRKSVELLSRYINHSPSLSWSHGRRSGFIGSELQQAPCTKVRPVALHAAIMQRIEAKQTEPGGPVLCEEFMAAHFCQQNSSHDDADKAQWVKNINLPLCLITS